MPADSGKPIIANRRPKAAAIIPLATDCPAKEPTIAKPRMPSINCSGDSKDKITGSISGSEIPKAAAPQKPPMADAVKDAPSALAASPRLAIG